MKKRQMLITLIAYDVWAWSHKREPERPCDIFKLMAILDEMPTDELLAKYKDNHKVDFNIEYEVMCN